jgi:hypothetical protein
MSPCIQNRGITNLSFYDGFRLGSHLVVVLGEWHRFPEEILTFVSDAGHPFKPTSGGGRGRGRLSTAKGVLKIARPTLPLLLGWLGSAFRFSSDILNGHMTHCECASVVSHRRVTRIRPPHPFITIDERRNASRTTRLLPLHCRKEAARRVDSLERTAHVFHATTSTAHSSTAILIISET